MCGISLQSGVNRRLLTRLASGAFWKVDSLIAGRDKKNSIILQERLRDGITVLDTCSRFVDLTPEFRI
jgi:hypothetical protein